MLDNTIIKSKFNIKNRIFKIPGDVLENYGGGLLAIKIDKPNYELDKDEQLIIDYKLCDLISEDEWNTIMNELDNDKEKKKKSTKKKKAKRHQQIRPKSKK